MNMSKQLALIFALTALALSPTLAAAHDSSGDMPIGANVQGLLQWADSHNPELAATRHEAEAAKERIVSAGALPDPVLRTELQEFAGRAAPDSFNLLPNKVGSTKYTLIQNIPLWGKRGLRREVAEAESEQVKSQRGTTLAEIHFQIKSAFAMYYQAQRDIRLTNETLLLMRDLERIAQARYSHGLTPQQDVIRARSERTALQAELMTLEEDSHHAQTSLNLALNRPPYASFVDARELRPLPAVLDAVALEQRILANSPVMARQAAQISSAEKKRMLAEKNRYPDLTLGISPVQRGNRVDSWDAMLEINIPLQQESRRANEREAASLLAAAQERGQLARNQVVSGFRDSFQALGTARRIISLFKGQLLPQAELSLQSALVGYQAGKVDFTTLIEAQRVVRKVKSDLLKAEVEQEIRLSEIERLLGEEL